MPKPNLKALFADDPSILAILDAKEKEETLKTITDAVKPKRGIHITTKNGTVESLRGAKGEKGDKGDTPEKGKDYFTPKEIESFVKASTPIRGEDYFTEHDVHAFKSAVTPKKGIDYYEGKDGKDGQSIQGEKGEKGDRGEMGIGIPGRDGSPDTPQQIIDKVNSLEYAIEAKVIKDIPTVEDVLKELKSKQILEPKDIKGMPINMNDMRWHGGGLSSVSHDTTLTGNGTPSSPLSVVGGGGGIQSINTDTTSAQTLAVGTSGTDFAISDNGIGTHTFNLPTASHTNRGALSSADWDTFNNKGSGTVTSVATGTGLTGGTITGTGTIALDSKLSPADSLTGNSLKFLRVNAGETAVEYATVSGGGITIGTTTITSGTNTRILYDNSGVVGEYTLTGSGTVVAMQTSPALITPALGVATATSLAIGGATIGSNGLAVTGHLLLEGVTSTGATGTGNLVFATTPTLTTPVLGVATATSINGNTFTTGSYTLTGQAAKTLTFNGSITLTGTDAQTYTFPTTTATIARTDAAQTFTGTQTFSQVITTANAITASGNAATIPVTSRHNIVTNNSAATLTVTLTTTSAVNMQTAVVQVLDFSGVAQTISWVNTENSTVTVPTTSNGSTTLPLTVGFIYNSLTSKWRCVAAA